MSDEAREPGAPQEAALQDDAIIGRAFRWSLLVIVLVAAAVALGVRLAGPRAPAPATLDKDLGSIPDLEQETAALPAVRFVDITAAAGIDFVHVNGARGDKLLPETMGSGAAFFDLEGDEDPDLLLVNATHWPGAAAGGRKPTPALYRNDGAGSFADVTAGSGLDVSLYGVGVAAGDYDGDGDVDLFLTALGPNRLFRNDGGRFSDVTEAAGVAGGPTAWSTSAGFFDYDNDGDLDLFVCNYVRWSREIDIELDFSLNGVDRAYGPPTDYEGTHPYLYRNEGDGRFTDVSAAAGIRIDNPLTGLPVAKALALSFVDVDRDGWIDVLVANDTVRNFLFRNLGNGAFEELGTLSGLAFDGAGNATGAMGIDAAYYRNDGQLAVAIGNFANEMSSLYVAQQRLQFTDEAAGEGIGSPSRRFLSFGVFFFDYDLDGRVDLLQANGHLEDEIHQVQASQTYRQPAQLFWNRGPDARSCYGEVPGEAAGDLAKPIVGRAATYADIDGDGDLDVLLTQAGGRPVLLRNDQRLGHHWLRLRLIGRGSNRNAIGARVELAAGGMLQHRSVMPTRSYLSQVELPVTFGLGGHDRIDGLRIVWPDGAVGEVEAGAVDRMLRVARDGQAPGLVTAQSR